MDRELRGTVEQRLLAVVEFSSSGLLTVDGANRMSRLIDDLLAFSRVGVKSRALSPVGANKAVASALINLRSSIQKTGATVIGKLR